MYLNMSLNATHARSTCILKMVSWPALLSQAASVERAHWVSDLAGLWTGGSVPDQLYSLDIPQFPEGGVAHLPPLSPANLARNADSTAENGSTLSLPSDVWPAWSVFAEPQNDTRSWFPEHSESEASLFGVSLNGLQDEGSGQGVLQSGLFSGTGLDFQSWHSTLLPLVLSPSTQPQQVASLTALSDENNHVEQVSFSNASKIVLSQKESNEQDAFAVETWTATGPNTSIEYTSTAISSPRSTIDRTAGILQKMFEGLPRAEEPYDCDLIHYYDNVVNHTVVALEAGRGRLKSLHQMYSVVDGAGPKAVTVKSALRDAVLCVATMHRYSALTVLKERNESVPTSAALVLARQRRYAAISSLKCICMVENQQERQILGFAITLVLLSCVRS